MHQAQVVILSAHSLFIEGIVNRLKQYPQRIDLTILNPYKDNDFLKRIIEIQPSTLILDSFPEDKQKVEPLPYLLKTIPNLRVVCLDIKKNYIQVVNSSTRSVERVGELLEIITAEPEGDDLVDILVGSEDKDTAEEVVPKNPNS
jgi:hypothetical protein